MSDVGTVPRSSPSSSSSSSSLDSIQISITVDLVSASRRHLSFLRSIAGSPLLHSPASTLCSIRRYEEFWMPMMADLSRKSSSAPMLLPPLDVEWIWLCHSLDSERYCEYCLSKFGAIVDRPAILDEENAEYAANRCREIWNGRHPLEPFDFEIDDEDLRSTSTASDGGSGMKIFEAVIEQRDLCLFFSDPFVPEIVYLVSARRRYLNFLHLVAKSAAGNFRMVPAEDIRLMWHTHQSFPIRYATDMRGMGGFGRRMVRLNERATEEEVERTMRLWEAAFDEPYELAGAAVNPLMSPGRLFFNWDASDNNDVNRHYKGLQPRFLMEVLIFLRGNWEEKEVHKGSKTFLRLRTVRCHKEFKLDKFTFESSSEHWRKTWQLYCEFGTRGIVIEVRRRGSSFLRNSKLLKKIYLYWNDLLHSATLTLVKDVEFETKALLSATPPLQASYLLKSVPDCVTDDSGAMISDVILRMNRYRPQEGRWLSRTVLDHAGRGCFVTRTRVGRGFWRRGAETPAPVQWEERIIEVRVGQWSYVASSVGYAPEKVVGTATPARDESKDRKMVWSLSTGDVLTIQWECGFSFQIQSQNTKQTAVEVLEGRRLNYQVESADGEEEKQYVTLVRYSRERPEGKATALLNWKLQAAEFLPEEDAVFVLLLNAAILRTASRIRGEDVGGLLSRRRVMEALPGLRDWSSVLLPSSHFPRLQPWYWNSNAADVLASAESPQWTALHHRRLSPADGNHDLYRTAVLS